MQIKDLEQYLQIPGKSAADLVASEDARMAGTCECFISKKAS